MNSDNSARSIPLYNNIYIYTYIKFHENPHGWWSKLHFLGMSMDHSEFFQGDHPAEPERGHGFRFSFWEELAGHHHTTVLGGLLCCAGTWLFPAEQIHSIRILVYIYICLCIYLCIYIYICIYVYMYICIYVYMYYVYMYICIHVYMYYVYMYICIYIYTYYYYYSYYIIT